MSLYSFKIGKYHGHAFKVQIYSFYIKLEVIYLKTNFNIKLELGDWKE